MAKRNIVCVAGTSRINEKSTGGEIWSPNFHAHKNNNLPVDMIDNFQSTSATITKWPKSITKASQQPKADKLLQVLNSVLHWVMGEKGDTHLPDRWMQCKWRRHLDNFGSCWSCEVDCGRNDFGRRCWNQEDLCPNTSEVWAGDLLLINVKD